MPRCISSWGPFFDRFLIDCCSQLPHPNPENRAPAATGARFLKNRLPKLPLIFDPIFDPILVPTWLCFDTKNHQNSFNDRSQDVSKKWSILGSIFWPSWFHLGYQVGAMLATFSTKWGVFLEVCPFFVALEFSFRYFAPRADGVLHFWRRGPMGYPIFGARGRWSTPILAPFLCQVGTILGHLGWVCGAAQSVKNFWNQLGTGTEPNRTSSGHKPNRNEPNRCYSA